MTRVRSYGDRALLVDADDVATVHALDAAVRADPPRGLVDVVPGDRSLLLTFADGAAARAAAAAVAGLRPRADVVADAGPVVEIPVVYDGPDLAEVARRTGLAPAEVVARHSGRPYVVRRLGFAPGFAYLGPVDAALRLPRRPTPRTRVPAGAVAVADDTTAVYPGVSPGGWHLLGRTDVTLFDPDADPPALLAAGRTVRFVPVDALPGTAPAPAAAAAATASPTDPTAAGPVLHVVAAGPLTTVQDAGRPGWAHVGVPRAGAADRAAAALANDLVGNRSDAPLLEVAAGGLRLRATGAGIVVAVTGAAGPLTVAGLPVRRGGPVVVPAGTEIAVGPFTAGRHAYVAVRGGVRARHVLGSASRDVLSGLGPPPLRDGDVVPVGRPGDPGVVLRDPAPGGDLPEPAEPTVLDVAPGPRPEWLADDALATLLGHDYVVGDDANRVGVRLSGPPVGWAAAPPTFSEGVADGAVQVPPDGRPVLFGPDHPTTGGYPVVAVLTPAAQDAAAQLRPGAAVRFRACGAPATP